MNEYKSRGQFGGVNLIITTVIDSLLTNRERKFVYSEFKYFQMWWDLQSEERQGQTRELVNNGQLELVNGGFSSTDEACPNYELFIENYFQGRKWIEEHFG